MSELNEAKLTDTSDPKEGFVYWDKKHTTAYYVVAVYPNTKQVSYWDDEGNRKTTTVDKFKSTYVPSKSVSDYDIFEEEGSNKRCKFELSEEGRVVLSSSMDETAGLEVQKTSVNGNTVTVHVNGKKYSYKPQNGETPKEFAKHYDSIAKYSVGRAFQWIKKNATTVDSYAEK